MNIVLDTNVLVAGMINTAGAPGRIIDLLRNGTLRLVVDDRILREYTDVLSRDYFRKYFTKAETENVIEYFAKNSIRATSTVVIVDLPDISDIPFIEIALSQTVPLITGNLRHFPKSKIRDASVLSPRQFLFAFRTP